MKLLRNGLVSAAGAGVKAFTFGESVSTVASRRFLRLPDGAFAGVVWLTDAVV